MKKGEIEKRAQALPVAARTYAVTNDQTYTAACEFLVKIKDMRKTLRSFFDPIIKKAKQAHTEALEQRKRAEAPLDEAVNIVDPMIVAYKAEKRRAAEEEQRRLDEEAKAKTIAEPEATPVKVVKVKLDVPKVAGMTTRKTWVWDVESEMEIPIEYWRQVLDSAKINEIVNRDKGKTKIPGIKVWEKEKTVGT